MGELAEAFLHTVSNYPDDIAVSDGTRALTFAQLRDATQACPGAGEGPVLIECDRSVDTIVRIVGAILAGRTFVPLDPEMPAAKRAAIEETLASGVPEDALAVIFTSGSTGRPKGVAKGEASYLAFIRAFCATFDLGHDEVVGNQTPFFFDASSKDLLLMMYAGARLEIIPSRLFGLPMELITYLNERMVTYACWVPSAYSVVSQLHAFEEVVPTTLRHAHFVGEAFPLDHLRAWMDAVPAASYVNLYGSTELAGICCHCRLDPTRHYATLPMGEALAGCEVFLADGNELVAGPGATGEICVAGDTLAIEYLGDPEGTAKRFVEMQTPSGRVARVLRTGDLARVDEDGEMVFSGRSDYQIKHMGRRIELQEIEVVAQELPEIDLCCCAYDTRRQRIVMFCLLAPEVELAAREVRRLLKSHLSSYMVPGRVFVLDEMPRNANGKIDRAALNARL